MRMQTIPTGVFFSLDELVRSPRCSNAPISLVQRLSRPLSIPEKAQVDQALSAATQRRATFLRGRQVRAIQRHVVPPNPTACAQLERIQHADAVRASQRELRVARARLTISRAAASRSNRLMVENLTGEALKRRQLRAALAHSALLEKRQSILRAYLHRVSEIANGKRAERAQKIAPPASDSTPR